MIVISLFTPVQVNLSTLDVFLNIKQVTTLASSPEQLILVREMFFVHIRYKV